MTTGKNKEQFEEWLENQCRQMNYNICQWNDFDLEIWGQKDFRMQIGVYLAYYDSLGIDIDVNQEELTFNQAGIYINNKELREKIGLSVDVPGSWKTRNEAYKEAFKKADTLINKQLFQ